MSPRRLSTQVRWEWPGTKSNDLGTLVRPWIGIGQFAIYRANWANSKNASLNEEQAKRRYKRDMAIARQLSLVVITDFLCWCPICVMGLMAQSGHKIPSSAYAWSAVVVLPVNSAINPFLYTLRYLVSDVINKIWRRGQSRSGK